MKIGVVALYAVKNLDGVLDRRFSYDNRLETCLLYTSCKRARSLGGKNLRSRSQALVDGKLLIDFPPDTLYHVYSFGLPLHKIKNVIITHRHADHLYDNDFIQRRETYAYFDGEEFPLCVYGSQPTIDQISSRLQKSGAAKQKAVYKRQALICAGKESQIEFVDKTSFDDDELIPVNIKSYVEYARTNGIVNGYTLDNGQTVFASSDPISRAEAAVIVDRILSLPDNDTVITGQFDDCASVESWAGQALANLNAIGIFKGNGYGEMLPDNNVTRAETAEILCSICDYSTETVSSSQKSKPNILNLFGLLGD